MIVPLDSMIIDFFVLFAPVPAIFCFEDVQLALLSWQRQCSDIVAIQVGFIVYMPEFSKGVVQCRVVSLCMSPKNDCFMSGALDHTVRLWDLRTNVCQVMCLYSGLHLLQYSLCL